MSENESAEKNLNEFSAETICAVKLFERLSPEDKKAIFELLRRLNGLK